MLLLILSKAGSESLIWSVSRLIHIWSQFWVDTCETFLVNLLLLLNYSVTFCHYLIHHLWCILLLLLLSRNLIQVSSSRINLAIAEQLSGWIIIWPELFEIITALIVYLAIVREWVSLYISIWRRELYVRAWTFKDAESILRGLDLRHNSFIFPSSSWWQNRKKTIEAILLWHRPWGRLLCGSARLA